MTDGTDRRSFLKKGLALTTAAATTGAVPERARLDASADT